MDQFRWSPVRAFLTAFILLLLPFCGEPRPERDSEDEAGAPASEQELKATIDRLIRLHGADSLDLVPPYLELAALYQRSANFKEAENTLQSAQKVVAGAGAKDFSRIVAVEVALASFYSDQGWRWKGFASVAVQGALQAKPALEAWFDDVGNFDGLQLSREGELLGGDEGKVLVGASLPTLADTGWGLEGKGNRVAISFTHLGDDCPGGLCSGAVCVACDAEKSGCDFAIKVADTSFGLDRDPAGVGCASSLSPAAAGGEMEKLSDPFARSEKLFAQAIEILEKNIGTEHRDLIEPLLGLALLYKRSEKAAAAEVTLQRAQTLASKTDSGTAAAREAEVEKAAHSLDRDVLQRRRARVQEVLKDIEATKVALEAWFDDAGNFDDLAVDPKGGGILARGTLHVGARLQAWPGVLWSVSGSGNRVVIGFDFDAENCPTADCSGRVCFECNADTSECAMAKQVGDGSLGLNADEAGIGCSPATQ